MKIVANTKRLAQTLSEVATFVPSKTVVRILKYAKITTKGNRMKIEANNQESGIVKYIEIEECDTDGSFLIDIVEFSKFVSKIQSDTVEITAEGESVSLKHSKGDADFTTANADDYPSFTMNDDESVELELPTSLLANVIDKGKNFVSTDMVRPQMTAIYVYIKEGKFGFCATDSSKLAHGEIPTDIIGEVEWLIMPSSFNALKKACDENDTVSLKVSEKKVLYRFSNTHIVSAIAQGKYPNFKRVIPAEYSIECDMEKADVLDALKRLQLFCDNTGCIKMEISPLDMKLSVQNLALAKSSTEHLMHSGCNQSITLGVTATNLASCFDCFRDGEVTVKMNDPARPVTFVRKDNPNFLALTMPMQLID